ncbi:hypothetical protein CBR_g22360 [Chara braunii]|uniref:Uncharacterized protein n=1 Tax=Chara braunii TaxID=69332 RepID=A0A388JUX9_CHABU|nr:hypothetical protein CBR_g22360 [Chara braunii]|eukprot:GBG61563.1 hypothetical protein CBR_g22360 [Chara braunii]
MSCGRLFGDLRHVPKPLEEAGPAPRLSFFLPFVSRFNPQVCKTKLRSAMAHIPHVVQKRQRLMEQRRAEVVDALSNQAPELARTKLKVFLADEAFLEAIPLVQAMETPFVQYVDLLRNYRQCPPDLQQVVHTLTYAAVVCQSDIPEFTPFLQQMKYKYGKRFVSWIQYGNPGLQIENTVRAKLEMDVDKAMSFEEQEARLQQIAQEAGIAMSTTAVGGEGRRVSFCP